MDLSPLLPFLVSTPAFDQLADRLKERPHARERAFSLSLGLPRAGRAAVLAALSRTGIGPILVLTARAERVLALRDELTAWQPGLEPQIFSEPAPLFYEASAWGPRTVRERITCLARLSEASLPGTRPAAPLVVIASARALITPTTPLRNFLTANRILSPGSGISPEALARLLVDTGYRAESLVIEPGQFARRGGILDLWPPAEREPVRAEFFGDDIDTLRAFDPSTQRTTQPVERLRITPARELLPRDLAAAQKKATLPEDGALTAADYLLPWVYPPAGILDHLPSSGLVALDDVHELEDAVAGLEEHALKLHADAVAGGQLAEDSPRAHLTWDDVREALEGRGALYLGRGEADTDALPLGESFHPAPRFGGQLKSFVEQVHHYRELGERTVVVSRQADRLAEVWHEQRPAEEAAPPADLPLTAPEESGLRFVQGSLPEGFTFESLHLLTDGEIFGWIRPEPRRRPTPKASSPEAAYADLKPGDYVVHIEYGIGQYNSLVLRTVDSLDREYLLVEFGDGGQVYVPIHQADRITRYIGADERAPTLSRLGSQEWVAARERAKTAAVDVAREMLALYARREAAKGRAYAADTVWQHELEASFPYTETEDQLRAIGEVKRDMERPRPMDRLICGDVGYGKTEVALRAAFKAVMEGVQVAVLVPTTVLAQQHFQTFSQRLAAFPVRLDMLSRFRTPAEQDAILGRLAAGELDILIGTHRLIQRDVGFQNLGLVIIDEEQRFGVAHKEHLKKLRAEVDVLTLTATPIPRTLYLSLAGVRDISMINTPPEERLPIITHLGPFSEPLVRQAVLREIERNGQVFFLHNRVESIRVVEQKLAALVPEARIRIAHGQMPEHELESAMDDFVRQEVDVLLCTSIIESGLDIPNANTLIVDRADTFGLAQLYQLRGRVGRGPVRAYAYFFTDRRHRPTPEAYERLQTLAEQTELGAGYAIAMRDLEIRGAGEILGNRQSGHIAAIGFHLYTRLLSSAVRRLRAQQEGGAAVDDLPPASVDLPLAAALPEEYVASKDLRLRLYRRMAELTRLEDLELLRQELQDRFGALPDAAENLLYQIRVKIMAQTVGAESVAMEGGVLTMRVGLAENISPAAVHPAARYSRGVLYLPAAGGPDSWKPALLLSLKKLGELAREYRSITSSG